MQFCNPSDPKGVHGTIAPPLNTLLAMAKQEPCQTLEEFLHSLQKLATDCNFRAVFSVQCKQEMVCDAIVNGLLSNGSNRFF